MRVLASVIAPLAAKIDADDWFPRELWPAMGELGLHGITVEPLATAKLSVYRKPLEQETTV